MSRISRLTSEPQYTEALVLGAGGQGKVLVELMLRRGGLKPVGVLEAEASRKGQDVLGVPVIGDDSALADFDPAGVVLVNGVGSTRSTAARRELFMRCKNMGFRFATLIHPSAIVADDAVLGEGVQVLAGAIINAGARIGEDSIINTAVVVEHDCRIGAHVHVASGAVLAGGVVLKDGVHVGAGATVIQGITVGERTVIGAGAVVIRDLGQDTVAVGVPARARAVR
jgi:UDP-perosamine 4-acetyltransferase